MKNLYNIKWWLYVIVRKYREYREPLTVFPKSRFSRTVSSSWKKCCCMMLFFLCGFFRYLLVLIFYYVGLDKSFHHSNNQKFWANNSPQIFAFTVFEFSHQLFLSADFWDGPSYRYQQIRFPISRRKHNTSINEFICSLSKIFDWFSSQGITNECLLKKNKIMKGHNGFPFLS